MAPVTRPTGFPSSTSDASGSASVDDVQVLQRELERMTTYAQALEQRCNRLWTYIPDTHGTRDPVVPFVARHCELTERSGEAQRPRRGA